jgi:hypothetical protein
MIVWRRTGIVLGLLLAGLAGCTADGARDADVSSSSSELALAAQIGPILVPPPGPLAFTVKAAGRMCVDFGGQAFWKVGAPAFLYWCNGTVAQQVSITEVAAHDVNLHVGPFCVGAHGGPVAGAALELQVCDGNERQQFAFDGDSIIAGHRPRIIAGIGAERAAEAAAVAVGDSIAPGVARPSIITGPPPATNAIARELVVTTLGDATAARTPLVLGPRHLTKNEDFRFVATDGSNRPPHSGFVRPTDGPSLVGAILDASWGTVIELASGVSYDLTWQAENAIPAGVTLRGNRRFTDEGALIAYDDNSSSSPIHVLTVAANDVRITGLRFEGPTRDSSVSAFNTIGIDIHDGYRVTVDHVAAAGFTVAAVEVVGTDQADETACPASPPPLPRPTTVRVSRSFFHHNVADGEGYGVVTGHGAFTRIEGSTFSMNRHGLAADYRGTTGYIATDNLVLSNVPSYRLGFEKEQDFDQHGSDPSSHHTGGFAGDHTEMLSNTFLGQDHRNVEIRGIPCRTSTIAGNVFTQFFGTYTSLFHWSAGAVELFDRYGIAQEAIPNVTYGANQFAAPNPTSDLGVADFDGDGVDDLFLATGAAWYYASGGTGEWRFLRRATEHINALRFGDVDGDGRADVLAVHTLGSLDVSWGGESSWRTLSTTPAALPITSFTIGNFDGDRLHGDDVFMTNESVWFVAPSGHGWAPVNTSSFPMSHLRFGDFDGDGRTDVLGVNGGKWSIASAALGDWVTLGGISTSSLDGLFVADLDGDGIADVVKDDGGDVSYAKSGRNAFVAIRSTDGQKIIAHGRFQGGLREGLLWWSDEVIDIGPGLTAPATRWSRQDMR